MTDAEGRVCQLEETDRKLMEAIRDAILVEVRAVKEITQAAIKELRGETSRIETKAVDDIELLHKRITDKDSERILEQSNLQAGIDATGAAISTLEKKMNGLAIKVLVGIIVTLGVPIGSWFVAQTIHLITAHAGGTP